MILNNKNNASEDKSKKGNASSINSVVISEDYISNLKEYTEKRLNVSNDIIVHDLIEKEGNNILKKEDSEG